MLVAMTLFAFGVADVLGIAVGRFSRARTPRATFIVAVVVSLVIGGVLWEVGRSARVPSGPLVAEVVGLTALSFLWRATPWLTAGRKLPEQTLGLWVIAAPLAGNVAAIGTITIGHGWLLTWLEGLPWTSGHATPDHVLLALAALPFLCSTSNRVIRYALKVMADLPSEESEVAGGRFIGPLERLIVTAAIVAGSAAGAALVVAAKGLLRWPELKDRSNAEYIIVGTLLSITLGGAIGVLIRVG